MNLEATRFIAALVHDLKNLVAPLRYSIEIVQRLAGGDSNVAQTAAAMRAQVDALSTYVDRVRDLALVHSADFSIDKRRTILQEIIDAAVETVRPLVESKKQSLQVVLPALPMYVAADADRLTQALFEVLHNASSFSDEGDEVVLMTVTTGSNILIGIRDSGAGIAPEALPGLFAMAGKTNQQQEVVPTRLGIGLALVAGIIEKHGGSIDVVSEGVGKGCEVRILVPAATPEPSGVHGEGSTSGDGATMIEGGGTTRDHESKPKVGAKRVLLADDSQWLRQTLKTFLEQLGYAVMTVKDGPLALQTTKEWHPEVVLLDFYMPGLNGIETAKALRREVPDERLKLVLLSGADLTDAMVEAARGAGFDASIDKTAPSEEWAELLQILSDGKT